MPKVQNDASPKTTDSKATKAKAAVDKKKVAAAKKAAAEKAKADKEKAKAKEAKAKAKAAADKEKAAAKKAAAEKRAAAKDPKTLNKAQIKILSVLAKAKNPMSKKDIVAKGVEVTSFGGMVGLLNPEKRAICEERDGRVSLITHKFVKIEVFPREEGGTVYSITASGRKALEKIG